MGVRMRVLEQRRLITDKSLWVVCLVSADIPPIPATSQIPTVIFGRRLVL